MQVARDTVVRIHYKLTDDAGEVLDSSEDSEPLVYVHGAGGLIPGLEKELEGRAGGDAFNVRVPPEEAYGTRNEELVHSVSREQLPDGIELGTRLQAETGDEVVLLTVVGFEDELVQLDANHPLAGVALNFEVSVVDVREATAEEIAHGHVHGPGGHEH
jgi:FKBP-type peptidyl-prolyl cis-trans isomerase SlyD